MMKVSDPKGSKKPKNQKPKPKHEPAENPPTQKLEATREK
jgi:hypothetical protein